MGKFGPALLVWCGAAYAAAFVSANAQTPTPPAGTPAGSTANCFSPPAKLPDAAITEFRSNPAQLLSAFPDGGSRMILQVRRLAGSDSGVVDLIIEQAKMANPSQVSAIGAGLAQVVRACVPTRPDIAELIQQKITLAGLQSLTTAFQAGLGDVETAGIGGGGGGGAAGGGVAGSGGVFGTSGPAAGIGGGGVLTGQFSFGSLGVSSSGGGGSTVIFNTFINNGSVSPVQ